MRYRLQTSWNHTQIPRKNDENERNLSSHLSPSLRDPCPPHSACVCPVQMQILYNIGLRVLPECGSVFVEPPVCSGTFFAPLGPFARLWLSRLERASNNL